VAFFFFLPGHLFSQKNKADSLGNLLANEKIDSNKVTLMWKQAEAISMYNPEKAVLLSQQALFIADRINYMEGQSRSLGILANTFIKLGNYPRALEYQIKKLKIEEKRHKPRNLASVLMNIGVVYIYQEEYRKSLQYYSQSDSVIAAFDLEDLKYYSALNLGDVYDRLNLPDSAFIYFSKALTIARNLQDGDLVGTAMTGLGHTYLKQENYPLSLDNYRSAIAYLQAANDDEVLCEAALGLAKLFQQTNQPDSVVYYANLSQRLANAAGFLNMDLQASTFLATHYKLQKNTDSAFAYISHVQTINDSLNSKSRIRETQILTSNEQLRQQEIEESKRVAKVERKQQLQMLLIAIFIPGFFMISILLSRINIPIKIIRVLGILSLLFLFEYLTLLLHPYVKEITHHTPVYEIMIFVSIAAILIPAHHRIEHWFINKLTGRRLQQSGSLLKLKTNKIKLKR